jgi:hypothetical protein
MLELEYEYELYMLDKQIDYTKMGCLARRYDGFFLYKCRGYKRMNHVLTLQDFTLTQNSYMISISIDNIFVIQGIITDELLHKQIC